MPNLFGGGGSSANNDALAAQQRRSLAEIAASKGEVDQAAATGGTKKGNRLLTYLKLGSAPETLG